MAFANPHAVTSTGNGTATTTYSYDNDGNLISAGNGSATTTYTYDYANRLIALFSGGATTTYGYDAFGARVFQIVATTSTSTYPFKFFSVASTTKGTTNYSTSTEYIFNGDTLLSTIDQKLVNGAASGTAAVRYVHPDHLGSTDVVTDQNQNLVQTLSYYPYGATRVSVSTSTNEKRKFIGQFSDDSGLSYLNARYYDSARGQFLSEDPLFLSDQKRQNLKDPQSFNAYSYSEGNPINRSDPTGLYSLWQVADGRATWSQYWGDVNDGAQMMGQNGAWNFAFNHPVATGMLVVGPLSGVAAASGAEIIPAINAATYPGVGAAYAAKQGFAALVYAALTAGSLSSISDSVNSLRQANPSQPWSYFPTALSLTTNVLPSLAGNYVGAISDAYQFAGLLTQTLGNAASNVYSSSAKSSGRPFYLDSGGRLTGASGSGGYVISNGQTPVSRGKGGSASYCLGVCKQ